jgi:guanosine-3',5'-bis(diphosphate) 3'-pyrophosphohydrolase
VLATPNPDWLSFVNTTKARRAIQSILRDQDVDEQRTIGRQALNRALRLYHRDIRDLDDQDWQDLLNWQHLSSCDQLFEQIAVGDLLPQMVATRLLSGQMCAIDQDSDQLIQGTEGIELRYAQCCAPILGDPIQGHLTRRGMVVHRQRCGNLAHELSQHPEHVVSLDWQKQTSDDPRFPVLLGISQTLDDEKVSELLYLVRQLQAGVEKLDYHGQQLHLSVLVRDRNHLARVIREIRVLLDFPRVTRLVS